MIILYHFRNAAPLPLGQLHPLFHRGYLLTDFFIIDSGYVLARIYGERLAERQLSVARYMRQRLLRVVPAHLAVSLILAALVATVALAGVRPSNPEWFDWRELPAQISLLQAYGVPGGRGWNAPTWTLSALLGCYLVLPWLCRGLLRLPPSAALVVSAVFVLAANLAVNVMLGMPVYEMPMRYGFLRALPLFVLGVGVALFAGRVWIAPQAAKALGLSAAAALAIVQLYGFHDLASLALMTTIILAAGAVLSKPSPVVEHLALMAFSMFLTNEVTRIVWFGVFDAIGHARWSLGLRWSVWGGGLVATFAGAAVFRYALDRPVQSWLNPSPCIARIGQKERSPSIRVLHGQRYSLSQRRPCDLWCGCSAGRPCYGTAWDSSRPDTVGWRRCLRRSSPCLS